MSFVNPFEPKNNNAGTGFVDPFKPKAATLQRTPVAPAAPAAPAEKSGLLRRALGDTAVDVGRGVIGVGEAAVGLLNIPTLGLAGKGFETIGWDPAKSKEMIGELYSPERKAANQKVADAEGFVDTAAAMIENPSTIAGGIIESAPSILGGGAIARGGAALLSRAASPALAAIPRATSGRMLLGAAGEGAMMAGAQAEAIRQQTDDGLLTPGQSALALGTGVVGGGLGIAGGKLANKLGIGDVDTLVAGGTTEAAAGAAPKSFLRRGAEGALVEGAFEEMPQSVAEQALQNLALGNPVEEGLGTSAAAGLLTGAALGGTVAALDRPETAPATGASANPAPAPNMPITEAALRTAVETAPTPEARAQAQQQLAALLEQQGRMLPAPNSTPIIGTDGGPSITPAQALDLAQQRTSLGLTPDITAAQRQNPAFTRPTLQRFPGAAPGSLADVANVIAAAQPAAPAATIDDIKKPVDKTPTAGVLFQPGDTMDPITGARIPAPAPTPPPNVDPETGAIDPERGEQAARSAILTQIEQGRVPDLRLIAGATGVTPRRASEIRAEIAQQRKAEAKAKAEGKPAPSAPQATEQPAPSPSAAMGETPSQDEPAVTGAATATLASEESDNAIQPNQPEGLEAPPSQPSGVSVAASDVPGGAGRVDAAAQEPAQDAAAPQGEVAPAVEAAQAPEATAGAQQDADELTARVKKAYVEAYNRKWPDRKITEQTLATYPNGGMAGELAKAVASKDADALIRLNLGDAESNPASRAAFEAATGVKLPKGRGATERAIDEWAGVSPEERAVRTSARKAKREAEVRERDEKAIEARASRTPVNADGRETTAKEWVDGLIAQGFDRIASVKRGGATRTALANPEGRGVLVPSAQGVAEYARIAARRAEVARAAQQAEAPAAEGDGDDAVSVRNIESPLEPRERYVPAEAEKGKAADFARRHIVPAAFKDGSRWMQTDRTRPYDIKKRRTMGGDTVLYGDINFYQEKEGGNEFSAAPEIRIRESNGGFVLDGGRYAYGGWDALPYGTFETKAEAIAAGEQAIRGTALLDKFPEGSSFAYPASIGTPPTPEKAEQQAEKPAERVPSSKKQAASDEDRSSMREENDRRDQIQANYQKAVKQAQDLFEAEVKGLKADEIKQAMARELRIRSIKAAGTKAGLIAQGKTMIADGAIELVQEVGALQKLNSTDASVIVRSFEDRRSGNLTLPSLLESLGESERPTVAEEAEDDDAPAPAATPEKKRIDEGFAENRSRIAELGLKKGERVGFEADGKVRYGTIGKIEAEQGMVTVLVPGSRGEADYTVPGRRVFREAAASDPVAAAAIESPLAATHADKGEAPQAADATDVAQAAAKVERAPTVSMAEARKSLLAKIDAAIADLPKDDAAYDEAVTMFQLTGDLLKATQKQVAAGKKGSAAELALREDNHAKSAQQVGFVTLAVPGDGTFKVVRIRERLEAFRKKVDAEFRDLGAPPIEQPAGKQYETRNPRMTQAQREAIMAEAESFDPESEVAAAAAEAATSPENDLPAPTEAQKEAGNYKKGHVALNGLDIAIENPAGSKRREEWPAMAHHYGYLKRTEGADGDHVDVFLSDDAGNPDLPVFIVDQRDRDGGFDEHKVMIGFADEAAARDGYLANYTKGWKGLGAITQMSLDEFKTWLREGDTTKPVAYTPPVAEQAAAAAPSPQAPSAGLRPKVRIKGGKPEYVLGHPDTLAAYFAPGRIIKAYGGLDRVIEFRPTEGDRGWSVQVQRVDAEGNDVPGERPRWHSTSPEPRDLVRDFGPPIAPQKAAEKPEAAAISDFGEKIGGARKDTATSTGSRAAAREATDDGTPTWAKRYEVSEIVASARPDQVGRWSVRDKRRKDSRGQAVIVGERNGYATREEAEAALPLIEVARNHRVVATSRSGETPQYGIVRDVTERKRVIVKPGFASRDEAMAYLAANPVEIIEARTSFGEVDIPLPPSKRRIGVARRDRDVRDSDFMDVFGFRGVEFGNWNNQTERQELLNDAYDGLLDLAGVLGVPPRALALNGELALAFGARGHGLSGARAHYEAERPVINLTKENGAGSLAHEWMHALDHYLWRQGNPSIKWTTNPDGTRSVDLRGEDFELNTMSGFTPAPGARKEVREVFNKLMNTMSRKAVQFVRDTQKADQFVAKARDNVKQQLDELRAELARQVDPRYSKRNNKPATPDQLAAFDTLAERIITGQAVEITSVTPPNARRGSLAFRWTNEAIDGISAIMKAVRGREGFTSDRKGPLDRLASSIRVYAERMEMLKKASEGQAETSAVPTDFKMDAKALDEGRVGDYWTKPHEMLARAFQGYVEDKVAELGGQSPFLNYGPENAVILAPQGLLRPFPRGDERKAINAVFDELFQTLQVRDEGDGRVALFSQPAPLRSGMLRAIETATGAPKRADAAAWKGWMDGAVRRGEFKKSERDWLDVDGWLDRQGGKVSREELAEFVRNNQVELEETVLGGDPTPVSDELAEWLDDGFNDPPETAKEWQNVADQLEREADEAGEADDWPQAQKLLRMSKEAFEIGENIHIGVAAFRGGAKFGDYTLPGGTNYREVLLTLPVDGAPADPISSLSREELGRIYETEIGYNPADDASISTAELMLMVRALPAAAEEAGTTAPTVPARGFQSSHWNQPNVLVHTRLADHRDAEGRPLLLVEEIQSDWHQSGRKRGYRGAADDRIATKAVRKDGYWEVIDQFGNFVSNVQDYANRAGGEQGAIAVAQERIAMSPGRGSRDMRVPDAPLKATGEWAMLAFKRAVAEAVARGLDRVAWTPGSVQADRFDLSKQVDRIEWHGTSDGKLVMVQPKRGNVLEFKVDDKGKVRGIGPGGTGNEFDGKALDEVVGKEMSERITKDRSGDLAGNGLQLGGTGIRKFYDQILPAEVKEWARKFGAKLTTTQLSGTDGANLFIDGMDGEWIVRHRLTMDGVAPAFDTRAEAERYLAEAKSAGVVTVNVLEITPAMRQAALDGLPVFSNQGAVDERLVELYREFDSGEDADGRQTFMSARDLLDSVEGIIKDSDTVPRAVIDAARAYRQELVEDIEEWGGRGADGAEDRFIEALSNAVSGSLSSPGRPVAQGVDAGALETAVTAVTSKWQGDAPEVLVKATPDELPDGLRGKRGAATAEGIYYRGRVYLIASNLSDLPRAMRVLAHEAFGHYGVEGVVGEKEWGIITRDIGAMRKRIGEQSDAMRAVLESVQERYPKATPEVFAKEVIAVMAERGVQASLLNRVIAAVRRFLRRLGMVDGFNETDLRDLVTRGMRRVEGKAKPVRLRDVMEQGAPAFASPMSAPAVASRVLRLMARNDSLFKFPKSSAMTLQGVFDDIKAGFSVTPSGDLRIPFEHDGSDTRRPPVADVYTIRRNGAEKKARLFVERGGKNRMYLDISEFESGEGLGSAVYAGLFNYAHNAGKVFIGDPTGLSDEALLRRTEHMLSAALKFGTTRMMEPHPRQVNPLGQFEGYKPQTWAHPVEWLTGNDAHNIAALLEASYHNHRQFVLEVPGVREALRDLPLGRDSSARGEIVPDGQLDRIAKEAGARFGAHPEPSFGRGRAAAFGRASVARFLLTERLVRGAESDQRLGFLAGLAAELSAGGLNPNEQRLFYSQPGPDAAKPGDPLFSQPPSTDDVGDAMRAAAREPSIPDRIREAWNGGDVQSIARKGLLYGVTLRHIAELAGDLLPSLRTYVATVQQMATDRNGMQESAAKLADRWERDQRKDRPGADAMANLMHDATITGVDPDVPYEPMKFSVLRPVTVDGKTTTQRVEVPVTRKNIEDEIKALKLRRRTADEATKEKIKQHIADLEAKMAEENARARAYPGLLARWQQLPDNFKDLYRAARQEYLDQSRRYEDALVARIESMMKEGKQRATYVAQVRQHFESQRLKGPYFPLSRFGTFWISAKDKNGEDAFFMFEKKGEWRRAQADLKARGYTIKAASEKFEDASAKNGPSSGFMADLMDTLEGAGVDDEAKDQVYQLYLRSLPDLSIRKHFIHRKKVAGYSQDALRAFAGNLFHGSFQIARLRHTHTLDLALQGMKERERELAKTDPENAAKAAQVLNEMTHRHEWVMNPRDSAVANSLTSLGFVWYLGVSPAAALVNLSQVPIVSFPVLAAKFGAGKASRALLDGMKRAIGSVNGDITRGLSDEERRAFKVWYESGGIDKSMAHGLAGLSESDTQAFSPVYRRTMEIVSWLFHKAEVVNREATALAAFRLAREGGMSFDQATSYAEETIWESQFDYTNANRARWMQGNVAKVVFLFRQYSLNMTWFLWRNAYQALKGERPEVKREARRKIAGVLGMTGVFSGLLGMPLANVMFGLANAAAAAFGDDEEPWDAEVAFRNFLADYLGPDAARTLTGGAIEAATGLEVSSRTSLNDLWIREPDRELEGEELGNYILQTLAGPMGGIGFGFLRGAQLMEEGHYWRALEATVPKFIRDGLRSVRYASEGVNSLRGDPIIPELGLGETIAQLSGFGPSRLADQYDANNAVKGYEERLLKKRQRLLNAFAMAAQAGDEDALRDTLARVRKWNSEVPALAIDGDSIRRSIRRSMAQRARYSERAAGGVVVDRRIEAQAREQARFAEGA